MVPAHLGCRKRRPAWYHPRGTVGQTPGGGTAPGPAGAWIAGMGRRGGGRRPAPSFQTLACHFSSPALRFRDGFLVWLTLLGHRCFCARRSALRTANSAVTRRADFEESPGLARDLLSALASPSAQGLPRTTDNLQGFSEPFKKARDFLAWLGSAPQPWQHSPTHHRGCGTGASRD